MNKIFLKNAALLAAIIAGIILTGGCAGSNTGALEDVKRTKLAADVLQSGQPTPTDFDYSLERYNLIRGAYWVNGQRQKALAYPCPISDVPLGYVVLFTESGSVVGRFVVEGKVSSLNSYLTPDSEYYERRESMNNRWLADIDGSYGGNDDGVFFFTPDGKYIEWTGIYLYSDIPFEVPDPIVKVGDRDE
jgi:hypothetical protein